MKVVWDELVVLSEEQAREFIADYRDRFRMPHPENGAIVDVAVMAGGGATLLPSSRYGDLTVPDRRGAIYVDGDLIVDGVLEQPFRSCPLLVCGNLVADHVVTTAELVVLGDATIKDVFYGNCTNYDTVIYGELSAESIILEKNHHFAVHGATEHRDVRLEDEVDGYDATAEWMAERGLESHDERGLAATLRAPS